MSQYKAGDRVHWDKDDEQFVVVGYMTNGDVALEQGARVFAASPSDIFPVQPKRVSDEELLDAFRRAATVQECRDLRAQILERMKAKGPTRGEVEKALVLVLDAKTEALASGRRDRLFKELDTFLSMFPEGE